MPLLDSSKINISLKKLLGTAHTDNGKAPGNEAIKSSLSLAASTIFGEALDTNPDDSSLYQITQGNVEFVRLVLSPDPSSNGHAFFAQLPSDYESQSSNPKKGTGVFVNSQVLHETKGLLQIVPAFFGLKYEAKPYRGGTSAKGSGALVPPGDVVDWNIDEFIGVIFQENDPNTSPAAMTFLECFIYTGKMVDEVIADSIGGAINDIPVSEAQKNATATLEVVTQVATADAKALKWLLSAQNATQSFAAEVFASVLGSSVLHQVYGVQTLGSPASDFLDIDVDVSGGNVRLLAGTSAAGVVVDVTQILVR